MSTQTPDQPDAGEQQTPPTDSGAPERTDSEVVPEPTLVDPDANSTEVLEAAEVAVTEETEVIDAEPIEPEPEPAGVEPATTEVLDAEVLDPGAVADPSGTEIVPDSADGTDTDVVEAEIVEAEPIAADEVVEAEPGVGEVPEPEAAPVSSLALEDADAPAPTGTDFTVAEPKPPAAPPMPPPAPVSSGGSFLDLPPLPDLPFTPPAPAAGPTVPPIQGQGAPSYPHASDYPSASQWGAAPSAQGPYGGTPTGYSEQTAAQSYGHGTWPTTSYEQPAAPPYTQPASPPYAQPSQAGAPYGTPTGFGVQPYTPQGADTTTASMAHWLPLVVAMVTGGALGFLAPLIIMMTKGQQDPFVRANAVESLNFNLTVLIGLIASVVLTFVLVGIIGLIVIPIMAIILQILGAIAANRGEVYRYPINIRFVK